MSDKKPTQKKVKIPTKTTLNLMIKEKSLASPSRLIPILLLIVVGAFAFSKFAVMDRLEKVNRQEAELAEMKRQLEMIQNAYADYDAIADEYSRYSYENFDRTIPDRIDVLEMLERWVMPVCKIQNLSINGRDLTMTIADITMDTVTYLNGVLTYEEEMVDRVFISSYVGADKDQSNDRTVTATVSIYLADASNTYNPDAFEFDPDAIINEGDQDNTDVVDEPVGDGTQMDNNTVEPENTDGVTDNADNADVNADENADVTADANTDANADVSADAAPVDGTENGGEE